MSKFVYKIDGIEIKISEDEMRTIIDNDDSLTGNRRGAYKAHITRDAKVLNYNPPKELVKKYAKECKYNNDAKNKVRNKIVQAFNMCDDTRKILTLESPQYLFTDLMKNKKIVIYENNLQEFKKLLEGRRKNVSIIFDDITNIKYDRFECANLDFCITIDQVTNLSQMVKYLWNTSYIAFTFSCRSHKKATDADRCLLDMSVRLQKMFRNHEITDDGCTYKNGKYGSPMVFVMLKRRDLCE